MIIDILVSFPHSCPPVLVPTTTATTTLTHCYYSHPLLLLSPTAITLTQPTCIQPTHPQMRRMVIGSVLMTDMTQHFQLLEAFNRARSKQPDINLWDEKDILLQLILHTADISNPFRVPRLATLWGELVTQEFIQQGDKERALGMQVTPTCDKDIVVVSTSQLRFAKWFVKVCGWRAWSMHIMRAWAMYGIYT